MWLRIRALLAKPWWVPPLILFIAFVVVQFALRGQDERLDWARWLLGPPVIISAVAMGPILSCRKRITWQNALSGFLLSLVFLGLALYFIPLWAGHGCWAPDLATLFIYLLTGIILAVITAVALGRRDESRLLAFARRASATFLLISIIATGLVFAVPGPVRFPPPTDTKPSIVWKFTPWEAYWIRWAPRLGWAYATGASYAPAPIGLGPDLLAFIGRANRLDILDPTTGARKLSIGGLPVQMPGGPAATAANEWQRPLVGGGHILLPKDSLTTILVDLQSRSLRPIDLPERLQVVAMATAGERGFYVLRADGVDLMGWDGKLIWSFRPPAQAPPREGNLLEIRPYSTRMNPWQLATCGQSLIGVQPEALYSLDPETGRSKWVRFPQGKFSGILVSPDGKTVYAADAWSGGRQIRAYTSAGELLWTYPLPAGCQQLEWQVFDSGLALAPDPATSNEVSIVDQGGKPKGSITVKKSGSNYYSLAAASGVLLVATTDMVSAYDPATGELLWTLESEGQRKGSYWYGYKFDQRGITEYQGLVIIPDYRGVGAYHPRTGKPQWFFPIPTLYLEPGPKLLYAVTSSGLFALANP